MRRRACRPDARHDDASAGYSEMPGADGRGAGDASDLLLSRLRARGRSELLDRFDGTHRPIAIVYDPWRRIDPASAPPMVELIARPTDRRARQPIPLLYNARWSLPAGRYSIELIASARAANRPPVPDAANGGQPGALTGTLSLQLGYSGRAAREWQVSMGTPGVWGRTFDLLTDINLVGFRASPEIERAGPMIRIRPETIVDVHARLPPAEIVSAALLGDTTVYFHDRRTQAEGDGFWTPGSSTDHGDASPRHAATRRCWRCARGRCARRSCSRRRAGGSASPGAEWRTARHAAGLEIRHAARADRNEHRVRARGDRSGQPGSPFARRVDHARRGQ